MQKNTFKEKASNYWRSIDKKILFSFILLFLLGLFFSFSSTSSLAGERLNKDYYFFFSKHFVFAIFSLLVMLGISFVDVDYLKRAIVPVFIITFISLMMVPIIGIEVKGSQRWLSLYYFRLQPVELIKPFFILFTAKILTLEKEETSSIHYFFTFLILASIIILLVNQPDVGQSILLIGTWISIIFISGVNLIYILSFFIFSIILLSLVLYVFQEKFEYIISRLKH